MHFFSTLDLKGGVVAVSRCMGKGGADPNETTSKNSGPLPLLFTLRDQLICKTTIKNVVFNNKKGHHMCSYLIFCPEILRNEYSYFRNNYGNEIYV
jgi:hypothetical protein